MFSDIRPPRRLSGSSSAGRRRRGKKKLSPLRHTRSSTDSDDGRPSSGKLSSSKRRIMHKKDLVEAVRSMSPAHAPSPLASPVSLMGSGPLRPLTSAGLGRPHTSKTIRAASSGGKGGSRGGSSAKKSLAALEQGLLRHSRKFNEVKVAADEKQVELDNLLSELRELETENALLERVATKATPEARRILTLKEEIVEAEESIAEAVHYRRTLQFMAVRLDGLHLQVDTRVKRLEDSVAAGEKEYEEVQHLMRQLQTGRARAVAALSAFRSTLAEERKAREKDLTARQQEATNAMRMEEWRKQREKQRLALEAELRGEMAKESSAPAAAAAAAAGGGATAAAAAAAAGRGDGEEADGSGAAAGSGDGADGVDGEGAEAAGGESDEREHERRHSGDGSGGGGSGGGDEHGASSGEAGGRRESAVDGGDATTSTSVSAVAAAAAAAAAVPGGSKKGLSFEEAFQQIRQATGVATLDEMVEKFLGQGNSRAALEEEKAEAETRLVRVKTQKETLRRQFADLKSSGIGGTELNREIYDKIDDDIMEEMASLKSTKASCERLEAVLMSVRQGALGLLQRLAPFQVLEHGEEMEVRAGVGTLDSLSLCEMKLMRMLEALNPTTSDSPTPRGSPIRSSAFEASRAAEEAAPSSEAVTAAALAKLKELMPLEEPVTHTNNIRVAARQMRSILSPRMFEEGLDAREEEEEEEFDMASRRTLLKRRAEEIVAEVGEHRKEPELTPAEKRAAEEAEAERRRRQRRRQRNARAAHKTFITAPTTRGRRRRRA
eukprot:PLAT3323.24.p1 GENE.PLAT3323.24~~PLAT3323.24.p1  ORF type:complete len:779 (-),score=324.31 PLAT3323.24:67-2403(-)